MAKKLTLTVFVIIMAALTLFGAHMASREARIVCGMAHSMYAQGIIDRGDLASIDHFAHNQNYFYPVRAYNRLHHTRRTLERIREDYQPESDGTYCGTTNFTN